MSANIYWRPVSKRHRSIGTSTPSAFVEAMKKAFGDYPWRLGEEAVSTLRGMEAASHKEAGFTEVIDAIDSNSEIEVWPQY